MEEKGAHHIPAALAALREHDGEWRAVLFGDGPDEERVRSAVAAAGVGDGGRAGVAPWQELPEHLARAAALVFPSVREGFGLVVLEAAAHGVPVVLLAAPDNAAVELVEDGANGKVVASPAPDEIARAVLDLAGPDRAEAVYDWAAEASRRFSVEAAVTAHTDLHGSLTR